MVLAGTTLVQTLSPQQRATGDTGKERTRDSVNSMLRSTMSRTKRRASKWLVPGCAVAMAAHRTSRSTGVGWLGSGGSLPSEAKTG